MKIAKVITILKTGDKSQFINYRPIALICYFLEMKKIFERGLIIFLKTIFLHGSHYCFQLERSTAMAHMYLVDS